MIEIKIVIFFIILSLCFFYLYLSNSLDLLIKITENEQLKCKLEKAEKDNMYLSGYIKKVDEEIIKENIKIINKEQ
jgi:hypothetical protein